MKEEVGHGCGVGCEMCPDPTTGLPMATDPDGDVWARNSPDRSSRSAYGDFRDVSHGKIVLVPVGAYYDAAPCNDQFGAACYNWVTCDCWPPPCSAVDPVTHKCSRGEGIGDVLQGKFPHCTTITATKWPPEIHCRTTRQEGPLPFAFQQSTPPGDPMFNLGVVTLNGPCSPNLMTGCTAKTVRPEGACCEVGPDNVQTAYCCEDPPLPLTDLCPEGSYYNRQNPDDRQDCFGEVRLQLPDDGVLPHLRLPSGSSDATAARIDAINIALNNIMRKRFSGGPGAANMVRFDRLDNATFAQSGRDGNDEIGLYERNWIFPSEGECEPLPPGQTDNDGSFIMKMDNSYLKQSRCAVRATLRLLSVSFRVHIYVLSFVTTEDSPFLYSWKPSARVHIHARFSTPATLSSQDPCHLLRPWMAESRRRDLEMAIINGEGCSWTARVEGRNPGPPPLRIVGADEIVFVDGQGRSFDPPETLDWWGYLGESSKVPWQETNPIERPGSNYSDRCCAGREALGQMTLSGWPYTLETDGAEESDSVYAGGFSMRMGI